MTWTQKTKPALDEEMIALAKEQTIALAKELNLSDRLLGSCLTPVKAPLAGPTGVLAGPTGVLAGPTGVLAGPTGI